MTTLHEAAQKALELCERIRDAREVWSMGELRSVCLNLRSALAQQGEQQLVAFDYQTAADFLNGKTINGELVSRFVSAARWAHDDNRSLRSAIQSLRGELAARDAEIAMLKNALMEAEAAPAAQPDAIGCTCSVCGEWQRWTPSGMVCKNGHGGVEGINHRLFSDAPAAQPLSGDATEVLKIGPEGRIFWRGREIESDDEFRAAMLDLANVLRGGLNAAPAAQPVQELVDAAFEAQRKQFVNLPRYSFHVVDGGVRRIDDRCGNWVEFDKAHALFEAPEVAAPAAQPNTRKVIEQMVTACREIEWSNNSNWQSLRAAVAIQVGQKLLEELDESKPTS